jgi:16S rRNA G966 N2-methylase RsmD
LSGVSINSVRGFAISYAIALFLLAPGSKELYQKIHPWQPGLDTYYKEGVEGVVMAFERNGVVRNYINGSAHGGRPGAVFVNEALVALSHSASPKRVLVIGFGTGALLEAIQLDTRVESVTLVELNRTAFENLAAIPLISTDLKAARMRLVFDDGRRFLERNHEQFDLVMMDPLRSKSAFSNNIYSEEFFRLVKKHLSNEGVFLVWTDDPTNRVDKGLAQNFEYVNRYAYFLVASKSRSSSARELYFALVWKLPVDFAREVQRHYALPLRGEGDILRGALCFNPPTDMKPYLEYYIGDLLFHKRTRCLG